MAEIAVERLQGRTVAQNLRPHDSALPYAESSVIAADMLRRGVKRIRVAVVPAEGQSVEDAKRQVARQIKDLTKSLI